MTKLTIYNGKATFQCKHYDLTVEDETCEIEFKLTDGKRSEYIQGT